MRPSGPGEGAPAFLAKLWQLVCEESTDALICWSPGGQSFLIKNQIDFARKVLPLYYKHNNMASFIRQLNMYGFHKVVSVDNGGLKSENETIQFIHPYFQRKQPSLLQHIKRKIANSNKTNNADDKALLKPELMTKVLLDVKQMKGRQESLDARFSMMKHENEALWREVALLRQKHVKQQQIVNNLIQFLMSLAQPSRNGPLKTGVKRRYQLMINDAAHNSEDDVENRNSKNSKLDSGADSEDENNFTLPDTEDEEGPTIHEVAAENYRSGDRSGANCVYISDIEPHMVTSPGSSIYMAPPSPTESLDMETFHFANTYDNIPTTKESVSFSRPLTTEDMIIKSLLKSSNLDPSPSNDKNDKKKPAEKEMSSTQAFTMNSQPSTTLPIDIFDSDENNSQDNSGLLMGANDPMNKPGQMSEDDELEARLRVDDYFNNVTAGTYNPSIVYGASSNSKGKSKSKKGKAKECIMKNIKEEIINPEDDADGNNMTLAVLPNDKATRPVLNRFHSVEDVDDHLHSMQNEIENLRELLMNGGESYTLDANTLLGANSNNQNLMQTMAWNIREPMLFHEEPIFGLSVNPSDVSMERPREPEDPDSQLISYVPPLGFDDLEMDEDLNGKMEEVRSVSPQNESTSLNTPLVQLLEPKFPKDSTD